MLFTKLFRKFRKESKGSAIIEFAIVAPVFFFFILGIIELGLVTFYMVVIESASNSAVRYIRTGYNPASGSMALDDYVRSDMQARSAGLLDKRAIIIRTLSAGFNPPPPDICMDNPLNLYPATCTKHKEYNGTPGYQQGSQPTLNVGAPGELIKIETLYKWNSLTGFEYLLGATPQDTLIRSVTFIRNEPA